MGEHCDRCQVRHAPVPGSTQPQDGPGPKAHPQPQLLASDQTTYPDAAWTPHSILPLTFTYPELDSCLTLPLTTPGHSLVLPMLIPSIASSATSARWSAKLSALLVSVVGGLRGKPRKGRGPARRYPVGAEPN